MLGYCGISQAQELGQLADRPLAVDELADDQQPMSVGECLQQLARLIRSTLHHFSIYIHTCVYTQLRIYGQVQNGRIEPAERFFQRRTSWRKSS